MRVGLEGSRGEHTPRIQRRDRWVGALQDLEGAYSEGPVVNSYRTKTWSSVSLASLPTVLCAWLCASHVVPASRPGPGGPIRLRVSLPWLSGQLLALKLQAECDLMFA